MFFLFGLRTKTKRINQIQYPCSKCARPTVFTALESKRWFTLFFTPVIPLGEGHLIRCNLCGLTLKCSPELKEQITAKAMAAERSTPISANELAPRHLLRFAHRWPMSSPTASPAVPRPKSLG